MMTTIKSLAALRKARIEAALSGVSYPMVYVREAWYVPDTSGAYQELQQMFRAGFPKLVHLLTSPPYPEAAERLAEYWWDMDEQSREEIYNAHLRLYMRLEWFTQYMRKRNGSPVPESDQDMFDLMQEQYEESIRKTL